MRIALLLPLFLIAAGCGESGPAPIACPTGGECPRGQLCLENHTCSRIQYATACTGDADCGGGRCVAMTCTRGCGGSADCPAGFDCRSVGEGSTVCVAATYPSGPGTFGTTCVRPDDFEACDAAQGFTCFEREVFDPEAYCTRACETDLDCAPAFYCATQRGEFTGSWPPAYVKNCRLRAWCAPCNFDEECAGPDARCIAATTGGGKYCSRLCTGDDTCPSAYQVSRSVFSGPAACEDLGDGTRACRHKYGACTGDGTLCAPCRSDRDCAEGTLCANNSYSNERWCTRPCGPGCPATYSCVTMSDRPIPGLANQCLPISDLQDPDLNRSMGCYRR